VNLNETIGYIVVLAVGWLLARFFPGSKTPAPVPTPAPAPPEGSTGRPLLDLILAVVRSRLAGGSPFPLPLAATIDPLATPPPGQPIASALPTMTPEELAMLDKLLDRALSHPTPPTPPLDTSPHPVK